VTNYWGACFKLRSPLKNFSIICVRYVWLCVLAQYRVPVPVFTITTFAVRETTAMLSCFGGMAPYRKNRILTLICLNVLFYLDRRSKTCVLNVKAIGFISSWPSRMVLRRGLFCSFRGGSTAAISDIMDEDLFEEGEEEEYGSDAYEMLAKAILSRFRSDDDADIDVPTLVRAFRVLSSSHKAFKGLDGAAHEAYQRTLATDEVDLSVTGRAKRSAARTAAVADGLGACELCELVSYPVPFELTTVNGTLEGRHILLNQTGVCVIGKLSVDVLVLFEPSYRGGAGRRHGDIDGSTQRQNQQLHSATGRILIIVGDSLSQDLRQMLKLLEQRPLSIAFGRQESQSGAVQASLYRVASQLLESVAPILRAHNTSAIHVTGRAISGGIAAIAASVLDGALPPLGVRRSPEQQSIGRSKQKLVDKLDESEEEFDIAQLQGLCRGRVSSVIIGAPPCLSSNIDVPFITSLLYGDDIIGRVSPESLDRFYRRTRRAIQQRSVIGKKLNWMSDSFSLATSNLQFHVFNGKDKNNRLAIPGRAFLIRPRRFGNQCSIHEIGSQLQGGREALRAAFFWQVNDILLSRSLWKHHQLHSYIHGLDRVHLKGLEDKVTVNYRVDTLKRR
jgi:hypothetical protein